MGNTINSNRALLDEIERLKIDLDETRENYLKIKNAHDVLFNEQKMFLSLTDSVPYGIYRIKVFSAAKTTPEQWQDSNDPPFRVHFVNDRFCSIMKIQKSDFLKKPGNSV